MREYNRPWLADHVLFFGYRWAVWLLAGALALREGSFSAYGPAFLATAVLNLVSTFVAQRYVRAAKRNSGVMIFDMLLVAPLLAWGDWQGPFGVYVTSSLVLPGLIYNWRGGLMGGLAFTPLALCVYWLNGQPPEALVSENLWLKLGIAMLFPSCFGMLSALAFALLRRSSTARKSAAPRQSPLANTPFDPTSTSDASRFAPIRRTVDAARKSFAEGSSFAAPTTTVRPTEQVVEDLRRVIFTPLPTGQVDLPAALDVLSARFSQSTGAIARVSVMGRVRALPRSHYLVLLRLTQETLLNVHQHAHASAISLTLRYDVASVALLVQDDGVGLTDGSYERPGLHALRAMQYRLNELGGRMAVFETDGGGVTVRATLPLE